MKKIVTTAAVAAALITAAVSPAAAQNREHQQQAAELRMLQEQQAQLALSIAQLTQALTDAVKAINNLPSPDKDQEKMYYLRLLPIAEDLIRSFRLLAASENQMATNLAAEIKLSELRLAALSGAYKPYAQMRVDGLSWRTFTMTGAASRVAVCIGRCTPTSAAPVTASPRSRSLARSTHSTSHPACRSQAAGDARPNG